MSCPDLKDSQFPMVYFGVLTVPQGLGSNASNQLLLGDFHLLQHKASKRSSQFLNFNYYCNQTPLIAKTEPSDHQSQPHTHVKCPEEHE